MLNPATLAPWGSSAARRTSDSLASLEDSAVSHLVTIAQESGWTDILPLASGEPVFPYPAGALEALRAANDRALTKYSPFKGHNALLALIQEKLRRANGVEAELDEIIVVPGGSMALLGAIRALADPGDEIIIPDPCWEHYEQIIKLCYGTAVRVPYIPSGSRYELDLDALRNSIGPRTKAVLLNSPLNPLGAVLAAKELQAITSICEIGGVWLILDNEYEAFAYDGVVHLSARVVSQHVIDLYSFSKSFALTGIRLGYVVAPKNIIDQMRRFALYSYMSPPSPSQCMAAGVLQGNYEEFTSQVRSVYQRKRDLLYEGLIGISGVDCWKPEGGVYLFPRLQTDSSLDVTKELLERYHLLAVPGAGSGENGVGHIRLFIGLEDSVLERAAACIRDYMGC
jgi:aspartate aminotransferase